MKSKKVARSVFQDWRTNNPRLHLLYVTWAIEHLAAIDKSIRDLSVFSNLNMHPVVGALLKQRENLTKHNPAYTDADAMLKSIQKYLPTVEEE